jgi:hypothetical protein
MISASSPRWGLFYEWGADDYVFLLFQASVLMIESSQWGRLCSWRCPGPAVAACSAPLNFQERPVSTPTHGNKDRQSVGLVALHKHLMSFTDERFARAGYRNSTGPDSTLDSTLDGALLSNDISRLF